MILNFKSNIIENIYKFIEQNNIEKIYLDIDGVILHSCQAICDMLNEIQGTNFKGNDILSWNFKEACPNLTDEQIEFLFADPIFFQYVKTIEGAYEFINQYKDKIILITKGTIGNICNKYLFFKDLNVAICGLPFNVSKGLINMSDGLFIDDCTNNLNESNAKYKIQFLEYNDHMNDKREWTKDWHGLKMYRW